MVHSYTLSSASYIIIDIYNTCFYPDHRILETNKIYRDLFSLLLSKLGPDSCQYPLRKK